jgi:hypothetical protein
MTTNNAMQGLGRINKEGFQKVAIRLVDAGSFRRLSHTMPRMIFVGVE